MPSLVSCHRGLIVILSLSLCILPLYTETWAYEVSDVQYGCLGSNVTLQCGTSASRRMVGEWRLNSRPLALLWYQVTSEGGLVLPQVDLSHEGNYSCHDNNGLFLHSVRLKLGYPPEKLSVSCQMPNHSLVICSWVEPVKSNLPSQYYASYRGRSVVSPCVIDPSLQCCIIERPSIYQPFHKLNITQANALGTETTLVNIQFDKLLKPDPPEGLWVEGVPGSPRKLNVSWLYPSSWHQDSVRFPLSFQLQYRPLGSKHWSTLEGMFSPLVITDALAGHEHELQVRARDQVELNSQWSGWSPLQLAWPWTDPSPEPEEFDDIFPFPTDEPDEPDSKTSTESSRRPEDDDAGVGLVILMALFAAFILVTVTFLFVLMWVRQRRQEEGTKQEVTSMVKLKSMPV
ncbi:interleukin-11 receptor subunit alpha-1-like [Osmerus mordax]|uniref:interleukin-11 receptor subunit alpha-1-like n=1 Tax=Osmerus mordax TaxID=8014 RepID=UPI00350EB6E7